MCVFNWGDIGLREPEGAKHAETSIRAGEEEGESSGREQEGVIERKEWRGNRDKEGEREREGRGREKAGKMNVIEGGGEGEGEKESRRRQEKMRYRGGKREERDL